MKLPSLKEFYRPIVLLCLYIYIYFICIDEFYFTHNNDTPRIFKESSFIPPILFTFFYILIIFIV